MLRNKLLVTNVQVLRLRKSFANGSSANVKFSKIQLSKMVKLGGSIFRRLPLGLENALPFELVDSIANSYAKELKNTISKKLNNKGMNDLLIHKHMSMLFLIFIP